VARMSGKRCPNEPAVHHLFGPGLDLRRRAELIDHVDVCGTCRRAIALRARAQMPFAVIGLGRRIRFARATIEEAPTRPPAPAR
jgi:hypothetical protein